MNGQLVTDPDRQIFEFHLYRLDDGRWCAVYIRDPEVVIEDDNWGRVWLACWSMRIALDLRRSCEHHTEAGS